MSFKKIFLFLVATFTLSTHPAKAMEKVTEEKVPVVSKKVDETKTYKLSVELIKKLLKQSKKNYIKIVNDIQNQVDFFERLSFLLDKETHAPKKREVTVEGINKDEWGRSEWFSRICIRDKKTNQVIKKIFAITKQHENDKVITGTDLSAPTITLKEKNKTVYLTHWFLNLVVSPLGSYSNFIPLYKRKMDLLGDKHGKIERKKGVAQEILKFCC